MDISEEQYKKDIMIEMQEEKRLQVELDNANKDIERKANIIATLGALIIGTGDVELIEKMNDELVKIV